MNNQNYIIVNNNQCFCQEVYRKSISKHYLFSKRTVPCLFTFTNDKLCEKFADEMSRYNFEEICLTDYDTDKKIKTPDNLFNLYRNVTLTGFLRKKEFTEEFETTRINKKHSDIINNLVYTQNLYLFSLESFMMYPEQKTDAKIKELY